MSITEKNQFNNEKHFFLKQSFWFFISNVLSRSILFILLPLYTYYMSIEEFGIFSVLLTFYYIVSIVIRGGVPSAMFKEYFQCKNEETKKRIIGTAYVYDIMIHILFGFIIYLFISAIANILNVSSPLFLGLAFLAASMDTLMLLGLSVYRAEEKAHIYAFFSISYAVLLLALSLLFIIGLHMTIEGALWAMIIAKLVIAIAILLSIMNRVSFSFNMEIVKEFVIIGGPLVFSGLFIWIINMSDKLVINNLVGSYYTGIYSLANRIAMIMSLVVFSPFSLIWGTHSLKLYYDTNKPEQFGIYFYKIIGFALLVGLSLNLWSPEIIRIVSGKSEYLNGLPVVFFIVSALIVNIMYHFHTFYPTVIKKTYIVSFFVFFGAILNITLNIIGVKIFGYIAASIATFISYLLIFILMYIYTHRKYAFPHYWIQLVVFISVYTIVSLYGVVYVRFTIGNEIIKLFLWLLSVYFISRKFNYISLIKDLIIKREL